MTLALFLVIVLLAYRAALVFGWHQGCRFILVRRAIRAERFERLLEQKSEECNQKGSDILALQAHIRELRGHLSNAQPELLRALHEEQAKSRGLARELQLYEDSFFDKNQQLIALERHIRELQEVLRGYESLRRSGHRVMTRAYNELEHHHNRYHRHGEIFVANRGAVWHWDGTCYKLQNATVRELWPCTSCANDVMTPHIPDEYGVSLENSITGWLVSADTFDTSAVDRPLFPMEVDVAVQGMPAMLALSTKPWLSYNFQGKNHCTPMSYEQLEFASSFASEQCAETRMISDEDEEHEQGEAQDPENNELLAGALADRTKEQVEAVRNRLRLRLGATSSNKLVSGKRLLEAVQSLGQDQEFQESEIKAEKHCSFKQPHARAVLVSEHPHNGDEKFGEAQVELPSGLGDEVKLE
eukprot:s3378_g1.t1